ncbi:hypothetical protein OIE66_17715 [Nonomuraea sp. NBC_01738]|uniref:hypothetical protein n=1 Tax=Nonomuraea sp. NBC_01738 TaxID=2976003 RepID=UPI002E137FEE|nr:hypothetical protein OIE66_17715 [Nonomuraea sp. NBC_01738]
MPTLASPASIPHRDVAASSTWSRARWTGETMVMAAAAAIFACVGGAWHRQSRPTRTITRRSTGRAAIISVSAWASECHLLDYRPSHPHQVIGHLHSAGHRLQLIQVIRFEEFRPGPLFGQRRDHRGLHVPGGCSMRCFLSL